MNNNEKFHKLLLLYQNINFESDSRKGLLNINDNSLLLLLDELLENDDFNLQLISGELSVSETIEIEANNPKLAIGILAVDLDELLTAPKAVFKEPANYFIIKNRFTRNDEAVPPNVIIYRAVIDFINLLREASAYLDEDKKEFIFISNGKFELPIKYENKQLSQIDVQNIKKILESFSNDTHREQKLAILSKSIQNLCGGLKKEERFAFLLLHLSELQKSFSEGYNLFAADFSYEKIINQVEAAKIEEIGKIHKTLSDIQNQILGIPVATIVVATQMKNEQSSDYNFWINSAILLGCWIFVILSLFILKNQKHTLEVIEEETKRKERLIRKEYQSLENEIKPSFLFIKKRLTLQKKFFHCIDAILIIGLLAAHTVYFAVTLSSKEWLHNIIKEILSLLL
jgi:hypothetical protein